MKKRKVEEEVIAEDYCFVCKDGGFLIVCDYQQCCKAYHPACVGMDVTILETGEPWTCSWHICFICNKKSQFHCFCCPIAVCQSCIKAAEFVIVGGNNGFCNECLKLALLIEENVDVDSDGGKVDFKDKETYECLFMEYWGMVKEKACLELETLHLADIRLKKGEQYLSGSHSGSFLNGEKDVHVLSSDEVHVDGKMVDGEFQHMEEPDRWQFTTKMSKGEVKSKKKELIGWGSRSLIEFLASIGIDTNKQISQLEVNSIITEYINKNNLMHPVKKKVLCDLRLRSIFGRKSINQNKIFGLLRSHFSGNQGQPEEDKYRCNLEDKGKDGLGSCQRQRMSSPERKTHKKKKVLEVPQSCFAPITPRNQGQPEEDKYRCSLEDKGKDGLGSCQRQRMSSPERKAHKKKKDLEVPQSCFASITPRNQGQPEEDKYRCSLEDKGKDGLGSGQRQRVSSPESNTHKKKKVLEVPQSCFASITPRNQGQPEEDKYRCSLEDKGKDGLGSRQKQRMSSLERNTHKKKKVLEVPQSCFASITPRNVRLVYLRRSLVEYLLKTPETFKEKVVGSFVRVKCEDHDCLQRNSHQLLQVTGIKNVLRTSDISAEIVLQVSDMKKEIYIQMLSDDDFPEVELEQKARILHEDIKNNWIDKELVKLQNLIDRANEKGWRRDLSEYLERRQVLQTPSERSRLLQEIPVIIAEEVELVVSPGDSPSDGKERTHDLPRSILIEDLENLNDDLAGDIKTSTQVVGGIDVAGDGSMFIQKPEKRVVEETMAPRGRTHTQFKEGEPSYMPKLEPKSESEVSSSSSKAQQVEEEVANFHANWYPGTLLRDTTKHLCNGIWEGWSGPKYKKYSSTKAVREWYLILPAAVRDRIKTAGFEFVAQIDSRAVDTTLLQALVERWWPSTHTFHLVTGEMTITPLCFHLLTGLRFGGQPVTPREQILEEDYPRAYSLLGIPISDPTIPMQRIRTLWDERTREEPVTDASSEETFDQLARSFLLFTVGQILFGDQRSRVSIEFAFLFETFEGAAGYDWGGSAYAYFLRMLDYLALRGHVTCGTIFVLIAWCYDHLSLRAPMPRDTQTDFFPRTSRWGYGNSVSRGEPSLCTVADIRGQLNTFLAVCWRPFEGMRPPMAKWTRRAQFLSTQRILFRGPSGYAWYLGERVTRQWHRLGIQMVPHTPPESMARVDDLSEVEAQPLMMGVNAAAFTDQDLDYNAFMMSETVCVRLSPQGPKYPRRQAPALAAPAREPPRPVASSSSHRFVPHSSDDDGTTRSVVRHAEPDDHLSGFPGWFVCDARAPRGVRVLESPDPTSVPGIPIPFTCVHVSRYHELRRMVTALQDYIYQMSIEMVSQDTTVEGLRHELRDCITQMGEMQREMDGLREQFKCQLEQERQSFAQERAEMVRRHKEIMEQERRLYTITLSAAQPLEGEASVAGGISHMGGNGRRISDGGAEEGVSETSVAGGGETNVVGGSSGMDRQGAVEEVSPADPESSTEVEAYMPQDPQPPPQQ